MHNSVSDSSEGRIQVQIRDSPPLSKHSTRASWRAKHIAVRTWRSQEACRSPGSLVPAQVGEGVALRTCYIRRAAPEPALESHPSQPAGGARDCGAAADSVFTDSSGRWEAVRGVGAGGAVLVRPDGHVAWRCCGGRGAAAAAAELRAAVAATLHLSGGA